MSKTARVAIAAAAIVVGGLVAGVAITPISKVDPDGKRWWALPF